MLIVFIFAFHNISTLLSSSNGALQWMQLKSQYGTMGQRGVIIRTPLTRCILHPIKEPKAEAVLLFGGQTYGPASHRHKSHFPFQCGLCWPQTQMPGLWFHHTSLVVWDSFSLPASLPKQTFSMATKDSANSPLK